MKYSPSQDDGFYAWQRIKVEPNLTETDLQQKIDQSNLAYDVMTYNCWHHSNSLYTFITGNVTHDYPGRGVLES